MTLFSCHLNCKALITIIVKHATPPIMDPHAQTHAVLTVETDAAQTMEIAMIVLRVCLDANATRRVVPGVCLVVTKSLDTVPVNKDGKKINVLVSSIIFYSDFSTFKIK